VSPTVVAIDLGASGGRVLSGTLGPGHGPGDEGGPRLVVEECSRFPNGPVRVPADGGEDLVWDILFLWKGIRRGLAEAARRGPIDAIGVDTWGVDYGLLDADGRLVANPSAYRSTRTDPAIDRVHAVMARSELYVRNGLQHQPFNTLFQLVADRSHAAVRDGVARTALLLPDLIAYWLTGRRVAEATNASTTGLIDPATRRWSPELLALLHDRFGVDVPGLLAPLVEPGTVIGPASLAGIPLRTREGGPTPVIAVGSHDTASAVAGVPAGGAGAFGFVSSGTWSLVGVELDHPVTTRESMAANFTNELGVDGTVRYLTNISGMWIQQECLRQWRDAGMRDMSWDALDRDTAAADPLRTLLDVNDPVFTPPGPMTQRIDAWARDHGEPVPRGRGAYLRAIVESLAVAYRRALREAAGLSGTPIGTVHIVGGGSRNALLCRLTADATGLPVIAGPVEGTAMGNMVVQLRAIGAVPQDCDLTALRRLIDRSAETTRVEPDTARAAVWEAADRRLPRTPV